MRSFSAATLTPSRATRKEGCLYAARAQAACGTGHVFSWSESDEESPPAGARDNNQLQRGGRHRRRVHVRPGVATPYRETSRHPALPHKCLWGTVLQATEKSYIQTLDPGATKADAEGTGQTQRKPVQNTCSVAEIWWENRFWRGARRLFRPKQAKSTRKWR